MVEAINILGLNSWNRLSIHLPSLYRTISPLCPFSKSTSHLAARVIHLKLKSDHVTPLLKKMLVSFRVRAIVPSRPCKAQHVPLLPCRPYLQPFPMNSAPAILASLLFPEHSSTLLPQDLFK